MSFSVGGDLASTASAARLGLVQARAVRVGTCLMAQSPAGPFTDAWWRFYVNARPGMVVHCGDRALSIPAWTLVVLPAWLTWRITMTAATPHCYADVDCPQISGRQIAERCDGALMIPAAAGAAYVRIARALLAGDVRVGAGNAVHAGIHAGLAHLVERLDLGERHPPDIAAILATITSGLGGDLRVPVLARQHGLGEKVLTALFHRHLGVTPAVYVRERRLAEACRLLRGSGLSIEAIATQVGFATRAYLSRAMAQSVGLPPAAYRRGAR